MSPEQARGEGHRVDGRSDIFSMGVLLYELLTGRKPFQSNDRHDLYEEIMYLEPVNPCHVNPEIPPELSRICMKCLSKLSGDRYQSAELLAADLRSAEVPLWSKAGQSEVQADQSTLKRDACLDQRGARATRCAERSTPV